MGEGLQSGTIQVFPSAALHFKHVEQFVAFDFTLIEKEHRMQPIYLYHFYITINIHQKNTGPVFRHTNMESTVATCNHAQNQIFLEERRVLCPSLPLSYLVILD